MPWPVTERPAARRRALAAVALSFGLHALAVFLLLRVGTVPRAPSHSLQVELRVVDPPRPAPAPRAAERAERRFHAPEAPVRPLVPPPAVPEAASEPEREAETRAGGDPSGGGPGVAGAAPQGSERGIAVPQVDLFAPRALVGALERGRGGASGAASGEADGSDDDLRDEPTGDDAASEKTRVSRRIGHDAARARAQSRVEQGLVDPYFRELRQGMHRRFRPDAGAFDRDGESGDGVGPTVRRAVRDYFSAGRQFAQTGSPFDRTPPRELRPAHPAERPSDGSSGFDMGEFGARWRDGDFAFLSGLVVVQLTQDADGRPLEARVVSSSGLPALDETAREAVLQAATGPAAPQNGLGLGGPRIKSLWRLEAKVFRCPPSAGGAFDETALVSKGGTIDADEERKAVDVCVPFTQKLKTTVELVAVYGGQTQPPAR